MEKKAPLLSGIDLALVMMKSFSFLIKAYHLFSGNSFYFISFCHVSDWIFLSFNHLPFLILDSDTILSYLEVCLMIVVTTFWFTPPGVVFWITNRSCCLWYKMTLFWLFVWTPQSCLYYVLMFLIWTVVDFFPNLKYKNWKHIF